MDGHRVVAAVTALVMFASPLAANAQCKADVDCKGDRICENGQCVDPRTKRADTPPPPAPPPPPKAEGDGVKVTIRDSGPVDEDPGTGWTLPAGIIGLVAGVGVLSLGIASAVTFDDFDISPGVPLGIGALGLLAVAGPITFVGAGSGRKSTGASGSLGLRIAGWAAYGITIAVGLFLFLYRVADILKSVPEVVIGIDAGVGLLSMVFFAADAFITWSEASEGAIAEEEPSFFPSLVWARESSGAAVPGVGMVGRF
jgi:hypothetical protein